MPGLSRAPSQQPRGQTPAPRPRPAQGGGGRGNSFLQDQLQGAQAAPCETPDLSGDYVTMTPSQKAEYLATLFNTPGVASTFDQRGFNARDQTQLAAVMQNEGGTNERRRGLVNHYESTARRLVQKLAAVGVELGQLEGAERARGLRLAEDERAVLTAAQQGRVDLAALSGEGATRDAAQANLAQVGVDHQTALYDEYSGLATKQRGGEALSREERTRYGLLQGRSLYSSGTFADARGLSSGRFRGVYDEGQTRFEAARYARSRNTLERHIAGGEEGEGGTVGVGRETSKDWLARHPEGREGNMDAMADAETSWGTAQVMGHYADRGDLHKADGTNFTMDDMRGAAARRSPNGTDVDMQISYFRDIAQVPGHLGSAEDISVQYNGPSAPQSYTDSLVSGASRYDRARDNLPDCDPSLRSDLPDPMRSMA